MPRQPDRCRCPGSTRIPRARRRRFGCRGPFARHASTSLPRRSSSASSGPNSLMPTGVRMPVASMSIRPWIGMVQAFVTPGIRTAESISAIRRSVRHTRPATRSSGLSVIVVSNMSSPAGSVAVVRPPRLPPHGLHLGETGQDLVLGPQHLADARHARTGNRGGHEQNRALVQRRHELAPHADSRESR